MRAWWPVLLSCSAMIASCAPNTAQVGPAGYAGMADAGPIEARVELDDDQLPFGKELKVSVVLLNRSGRPLRIDASGRGAHRLGRCGNSHGLRGSHWHVSIVQDPDGDGRFENLLHAGAAVPVGYRTPVRIPPGGEYVLRTVLRRWAPRDGELPSLEVPGPGQVCADIYLVVDGKHTVVWAKPAQIRLTGQRTPGIWLGL